LTRKKIIDFFYIYCLWFFVILLIVMFFLFSVFITLSFQRKNQKKANIIFTMDVIKHRG